MSARIIEDLRPPVQFCPRPASRGRRTGSSPSRGTTHNPIQFCPEKIMGICRTRGMMQQEPAMKHLGRTSSWLLAAALAGTLCPFSSQAKGYSSGGHSYSSSRSSGSSGSHSFGRPPVRGGPATVSAAVPVTVPASAARVSNPAAAGATRPPRRGTTATATATTPARVTPRTSDISSARALDQTGTPGRRALPPLPGGLSRARAIFHSIPPRRAHNGRKPAGGNTSGSKSRRPQPGLPRTLPARRPTRAGRRRSSPGTTTPTASPFTFRTRRSS